MRVRINAKTRINLTIGSLLTSLFEGLMGEDTEELAVDVNDPCYPFLQSSRINQDLKITSLAKELLKKPSEAEPHSVSRTTTVLKLPRDSL